MSPGTIIVVVIIAALMGLAIWGMIRSRKKGSCCGGCSGCSHAKACRTNKP